MLKCFQILLYLWRGKVRCNLAIQGTRLQRRARDFDTTIVHSLSRIWDTRSDSWDYLTSKHPNRVSAIESSFMLIDDCLEDYEALAATNTYARICGLTLVKGKSLAVGSLSLVLDALAQEAGALLRPLIEYIELLEYFSKFPEMVERASSNDLPKAGERAKAIGGIYKGLRDHLNEHASHSSYSYYSLAHFLTPESRYRVMQEFVPHVLDKNIRDFAVQLQFLAQNGVVALLPLKSPNLKRRVLAAEKIRQEVLSAFELNGS